MTRNDHSNQLELSIGPRSGVDSGQWDWGIIEVRGRDSSVGKSSVSQAGDLVRTLWGLDL